MNKTTKAVALSDDGRKDDMGNSHRYAAALTLTVAACGDRTGLGYQRSDGPMDGAVEGTGGATGEGGAILPQGAGGARPTGSGGARPGAGGAPVVVGAGGYVAAVGGAPSSSGGHVAATGGSGAGGAPEVVDAGPDADVDAGPNYCDPAVQCAAIADPFFPAGPICRGVMACPDRIHTVDCSLYVKCGSSEVCPGTGTVVYPPSRCVSKS